jgi:hypothetical protein
MDSARRDAVERRAGDRSEHCLLGQEHSPYGTMSSTWSRNNTAAQKILTTLALSLSSLAIFIRAQTSPASTQSRAGLCPFFNPRRDRWAEHFIFEVFASKESHHRPGHRARSGHERCAPPGTAFQCTHTDSPPEAGRASGGPKEILGFETSPVRRAYQSVSIHLRGLSRPFVPK